MGSYLSMIFRHNPLPTEVIHRECACTLDHTHTAQCEQYKPFESYWDRYPSAIWKTVAASSAFFGILNLSLPYLLPRILPGFESLSASSQRKFTYYVSSGIHHLIVSPWSIAKLIDEYRKAQRAAPGETLDFSDNLWLAGISGGYFVVDFLATLKDALASPDYFLHHAIALAVIFGGLSSRTARYIPHILVAETSTILLDIMWALRQYGQTGTPTYNLIGIVFVLVYTLTRIVNMPTVLTAIFTVHTRDLQSLGPSRHLLLGAQALQFWWYYKILQQFAPLLSVIRPFLSAAFRRAAHATALVSPLAGDR